MKRANQTKRAAKGSIFATLCLLVSLANGGEINTGGSGDVAIKGYDPVAYFTMGQASKGSEDHSLEWLGAVWHFSSAKHQEMFASSPVQYAPQYGGYCADGVSLGRVAANIDPDAWRIVDGKLYLNYDEKSAVKLEETPGHIEKADKHWKEHVHAEVKSQ